MPAALPRRGVLRAVLAASAAGWTIVPAFALHKVSKAEARYQDHPNGGLSCAACTLFRPPAGCAVVEGAISANGWCRFFDLPD